MMAVRLKPMAARSRVKHFTSEPHFVVVWHWSPMVVNVTNDVNGLH